MNGITEDDNDEGRGADEALKDEADQMEDFEEQSIQDDGLDVTVYRKWTSG